MKRHIAFFLLLVFAGSAHAANLQVPSQYATIQAAVDAASAGDVVYIAAGTYSDVTHTPGGGDTTKCVVVLKSGVSLHGAGIGRTIIDAAGLGRGVQCTGATDAYIKHLTIRHGFAAIYGAGLFCRDGASPAIGDCELTSNYDGALILLNGCSPSIYECRFTSNAGKEGGAIAMETNCSPVIERCTISGNTAPSAAAVIVRSGSFPQFTDCAFVGNHVSGTNGSGGAFSAISSSATITNCRFENNVATGPGGGLIFSETNAHVTGCLIRGNSTGGSYGPGGGVHVDFGSDVTLTGCTIVRNAVYGTDQYSDGGGVCAFFATQLTLDGCTVSANYSAGEGGAVACFFSSPTIEKCILSHSTGGRGISCDESSAPTISCTDIYGNTLGNTLCGTDAGHNFFLDPLFCDLTGNDYRLQAASPCAPGQHPDGAGACDGSRIGANDVGCAPVGVSGDAPPVAMMGNSPNPFRPETTIRYSLERDAQVRLDVFDVVGRRIRTLEDGPRSTGAHQAIWDGRDDAGLRVPSGVYFYRLSVDGVKESRRMVLAR